ncbi:MAG TPA: NAD(P)H-dependent oxidoreductase [Candidatus Saccharimonadales bacterium]
MKIAIVIGSVRQNRVSDRMARWVQNIAKDMAGEHEWEIIDLKDYDLPMFDEPMPPMANQRPELADGTKRYLEVMGQADGFIFVTPEYNHSTSSALLNAIDLLDYQLTKKPVAIAGHGVVGGARAIAHLKTVVNSNLGAVPTPGGLTVTDKVVNIISEDGLLAEDFEHNEAKLKKLIETIVWFADALKTAREK